MNWTYENIPDQDGRIAIVTGANTGIGFETARALALKGARVVLACRSRKRGEAALERIAAQRPKGQVEFGALDLADLDSVHAFAERFAQDNRRLDLLINNAGIMWCPQGTTEQGFELQFGVNHLGHFALTLRLLAQLYAAPIARVVTVSSQAHRRGRIALDDLNFVERGYDARAAYAQSKLANLLFTFELQRRFDTAGANTMAVAAHPGWTTTDLQRHASWVRVLSRFVAMSATRGALPTLRAATDSNARGAEYFGPDGFYEMRGDPERVGTTAAAQDCTVAARLWTVSEELTGLRFAGPTDADPRSRSA
jgi:NAD(P)-dependent dehydrogenase (short-subunit alcohol dehydrogenase family)